MSDPKSAYLDDKKYLITHDRVYEKQPDPTTILRSSKYSYRVGMQDDLFFIFFRSHESTDGGWCAFTSSFTSVEAAVNQIKAQIKIDGPMFNQSLAFIPIADSQEIA